MSRPHLGLLLLLAFMLPLAQEVRHHCVKGRTPFGKGRCFELQVSSFKDLFKKKYSSKDKDKLAQWVGQKKKPQYFQKPKNGGTVNKAKFAIQQDDKEVCAIFSNYFYSPARGVCKIMLKNEKYVTI